jgi:hypothetical protein
MCFWQHLSPEFGYILAHAHVSCFATHRYTAFIVLYPVGVSTASPLLTVDQAAYVTQTQAAAVEYAADECLL